MPEPGEGLNRGAHVPDVARVTCGRSLHGAGGTEAWHSGPLELDAFSQQPSLELLESERILGRVGALKDLAHLAGLHHERLDGSGYYRGSSRAEIPAAARVLAAADAYQAMTQPRPHRPPFAPEHAAQEREPS